MRQEGSQRGGLSGMRVPVRSNQFVAKLRLKIRKIDPLNLLFSQVPRDDHEDDTAATPRPLMQRRRGLYVDAVSGVEDARYLLVLRWLRCVALKDRVHRCGGVARAELFARQQLCSKML